MIFPDWVLTESTITTTSKAIKRLVSQRLSRIALKYPSSKNRTIGNGQT